MDVSIQLFTYIGNGPDLVHGTVVLNPWYRVAVLELQPASESPTRLLGPFLKFVIQQVCSGA